MATKNNSNSYVDVEKSSYYTDEYWGSVVFLVLKFMQRYRHIIPKCLSEEDFCQEAWLAKNGYISRYPWQACIRLMEKYSCYTDYELRKISEDGVLPTRDVVEIDEARGVIDKHNFSDTYIDIQTIFDAMDNVPLKNFRDIFMAYYNGKETEEIAEEFGLGLDRTRHIKSDGVKILKKFLVEIGYEERNKT